MAGFEVGEHGGVGSYELRVSSFEGRILTRASQLVARASSILVNLACWPRVFQIYFVVDINFRVEDYMVSHGQAFNCAGRNRLTTNS